MLKYNGYTASLKIDVDSGLLLGQVVDVNDSITFQAKTVEESIQEFHHAVDSYLRACAQVGKEPDKPFSGKMPFRTKPEIHKAIYLAAMRADKSMNAWMEEVLYQAACQADRE
ncbi:MAG: type II toxin-antitoxin system HicB family antitoxin [Leptolyngbyaceae bacterium]|nr:type II toxin-antitoxin system HicB family antitoxin [Leptolyngbyaceae bacterium]